MRLKWPCVGSLESCLGRSCPLCPNRYTCMGHLGTLGIFIIRFTEYILPTNSMSKHLSNIIVVILASKYDSMFVAMSSKTTTPWRRSFLGFKNIFYWSHWKHFGITELFGWDGSECMTSRTVVIYYISLKISRYISSANTQYLENLVKCNILSVLY